jgi:hypothetical protein
MRLSTVVPAFLLFGCNDYGFHPESKHNGPGVLEDTGGLDGGDDGGDDFGDDDDDDDDDGDDIDTDTPPDGMLDDCTPGTVATWMNGEIYVTSWDRDTQSGTLHVADSGWYHVYDYSIAESGDEQWNESAYIRIKNTTFPAGKPHFTNCNDDWVVVDSDNTGPMPSGSRIYVGTYWLLSGDNDLTMHHYCPVRRGGECAGLEITDNPDSTCDSSNGNSVHFNGEGICLVPAF